MKRPPTHFERLQIWRYAYAQSSFRDASASAKILQGVSARTSIALSKALVEHIVISYARPFSPCRLNSKNKKKEPLINPSVVPDQFSALHKQIIDLRNQAVGHKDATAFPDTLLNRVRFEVEAAGVAVQATSLATIGGKTCSELVSLCDQLAEYCAAKMNPILEPYFAGPDCPPAGAYCLNTDLDSEDWLRKIGCPP